MTTRYQNGKIYKLVNDVDDKIYVGSTCISLSRRLSNHKSASKRENYKNRPVYIHLNSIGWSGVKIILITEAKLENKMELLRLEQKYIEELRPELNRRSSIDDCSHGKQKCMCVECHGSYICIHDKQKHQCRECNNFKCHLCEVKLYSRYRLKMHSFSARHIKNYKFYKNECFRKMFQ